MSELPDNAERVFREYLTAIVLHAQSVAEAAGMDATEAYAMNLIGLDGALTAGELAERTGLTSGATTRLIDRLERRGAVRRTRDPADRRRVVVEAVDTDGDRDAMAAVDPARERVAAVFERYSIEQLRLLFGFFAESTTAFREATREVGRGRAASRGRGPRPDAAQ